MELQMDIAYFLAGMFLHSFAISFKISGIFGWFGSILAPLILILFYLNQGNTTRYIFDACCPLFLLACLDSKSMLSKICAFSPIVYLGELSYSLYLTHGIVLKALKALISIDHFQKSSLDIRLGIILIDLICLAIATYLMYTFIEKPSRQWLRKKTDRSSDSITRKFLNTKSIFEKS
jgi:peptidoglycan/LPS O-acetylase OafA/YrhL